jgi:hypothetical protein
VENVSNDTGVTPDATAPASEVKLTLPELAETSDVAKVEAYIDALLTLPDTPKSVLAEALVTGRRMYSDHEKAYETSGDVWYKVAAQNRIERYAPDREMHWKLHMRHLDRLADVGIPGAAEERRENTRSLAWGRFDPRFSFAETRYAYTRNPEPEIRSILSERFLNQHALQVPVTLDTFAEVVELGKMVLGDPEVSQQQGLADAFAATVEQWARRLQRGATDPVRITETMLSWSHSLAEYRRIQPN